MAGLHPLGNGRYRLVPFVYRFGVEYLPDETTLAPSRQGKTLGHAHFTTQCFQQVGEKFAQFASRNGHIGIEAIFFAF